MKTLYDYLQESIFKNPLETIKSVDLGAIFKYFKDKRDFTKGFDALKKFIDEQSEKTEVKSEDYENINPEKCYIAFIYNNQTGELTPPAWSVKIYVSNHDKTISFGGDVMMITGDSEIDPYKKEVKDGCDPKADITDIDSLGMVNMTVWEIIPELANILYNEYRKMFECEAGAGSAGAATPTNTMGAGNPTMPSDGKPGSGDLISYNPRHPATKKEKKDKSKTKKL